VKANLTLLPEDRAPRSRALPLLGGKRDDLPKIEKERHIGQPKMDLRKKDPLFPSTEGKRKKKKEKRCVLVPVISCVARRVQLKGGEERLRGLSALSCEREERRDGFLFERDPAEGEG